MQSDFTSIPNRRLTSDLASEGWQYRIVSRRDAEYLMLAPSVCGGWIAVDAPLDALDDGNPRGPYYWGGYLALMPPNLAHCGQTCSVETAQRIISDFERADARMAEVWAHEERLPDPIPCVACGREHNRAPIETCSRECSYALRNHRRRVRRGKAQSDDAIRVSDRVSAAKLRGGANRSA